MKKIVIAQDISRKLLKQNSFLNRSDIKVFAAASNEHMLEIHRTIHADLIITHFDLPRMKAERFCSLVKEGAAAGGPAVLLVCPTRTGPLLRCARCGVDAVLFEPIKTRKILAAVRKLLNLSWRETYRVLLNVAVEGSMGDQTFSCNSLDISSTGMLLETTQNFRIGDRVSCSFLLPDATRIEAAGDVVRTIAKLPGSDTNLYGIRFRSVAIDAQAALKSLIQAMSPQM